MLFSRNVRVTLINKSVISTLASTACLVPVYIGGHLEVDACDGFLVSTDGMSGSQGDDADTVRVK
jgi:hypothetical protein